MIKVLFYDSGKEWGGGTNSLFYLLENLDKKTYDISVHFEYDYEFRGWSISDEVRANGLKFIYPTKKPIPKLKKEFFRLLGREFLKKRILENDIEHATNILNHTKPDILHLNNQPSSNLHAIISADKLGIKTVLHLRKNVPLTKEEKEVLAKINFKSIAVSQSTKNFYLSEGLKDIEVVYNPIKIKEKTTQNYLNSSKKIKVLVPANYIPIKGHDLLFGSLELVRRDDIEVYLAGGGKFSRNLENMKNSLIQKGVVYELGFVNLDNIYKDVDYVMLLSKNEGLPRVIIESLSFGCGVIMSDIDVAHELKSMFNQSVFYIVQRNREDVASLLNQLQKQDKRFIDRDALANFDISNHLKKIENLYKSLL